MWESLLFDFGSVNQFFVRSAFLYVEGSFFGIKEMFGLQPVNFLVDFLRIFVRFAEFFSNLEAQGDPVGVIIVLRGVKNGLNVHVDIGLGEGYRRMLASSAYQVYPESGCGVP